MHLGKLIDFSASHSGYQSCKETILLWFETYYGARSVLKSAIEALHFLCRLISMHNHSVALLEPEAKLGFAANC